MANYKTILGILIKKNVDLIALMDEAQGQIIDRLSGNKSASQKIIIVVSHLTDSIQLIATY